MSTEDNRALPSDRAAPASAAEPVPVSGKASIPSAIEVRELLEYQNFSSHVQWVNKAPSWLTSHPRYNDGSDGRSSFRAVCFDAQGRQCAIGRDFKRAEDEGAFPVYWLWPDQIGEIALAAATARGCVQ